MAFRPLRSVACLTLLAVTASPATAQAPGGPPPAVGTATVRSRPITESNEFVGRVQAVNRVDLVARVTAYITDQLFTEGSEVAKGAVLYKLERGPFEADVNAKAATVEQNKALLRNAGLTLGRASSLLNTPAGQRSTVDDATAQQASQTAQVAGAMAQLRSSQINLDYTEIKAPVAGKISRTSLTVGNVVTPTSGPLATIVSQDPMYVVFAVSSRSAQDLATRYATKGGFAAINVRVRLADGSLYGPGGKLDYVDPTVSANTDTQIFRAVMPNPLRPGTKPGDLGDHALVDGAFVTAVVEGAEPVELLSIPRIAVLQDQQGTYVYVIGADNKAEQRRVTIGQSTPETASVTSGLKVGEQVVVDGLQRIRQPGQPVAPAPADAAAPASKTAG